MRGSWRAKIRKGEPQAPGRPERPEWLREEAKVVWDQLTAILEETGVLSRIDLNIVARYCQLWVRWRELDQFLVEHGTIYRFTGPNGVSYRSWPQVTQCNAHVDALIKIERELGLTPAARTRLRTGDVPQEAKDAEKKAYVKIG